MISRVATILRRLLSERSAETDHPYRPIILRTLQEAPSTGPAEGAPAFLRIETLSGSETDEQLARLLELALVDHRAKHGTGPRVVSVASVGAFEVAQLRQTPGCDPRLVGRVAVVTGAAGAIGYGICRALLERGCHVAITDLPGDRLDQFVAEFRTLDESRVLGVPLDVTDPASVASAFKRVIAQWGGIDIIVINAGAALAMPLVEIELDAFRRLERVNSEGTLLVLSEAGRHFTRQGMSGDIVLISTKNVFAPGAGFGAYSATKAAAHQLARIASLEFAPLGVRVNMVAPDAVFSGGAHKSGLWAEVGPGRMRARGLDANGLEEYYRNRNLLKAKVTAEHVANAVLFFGLRQTPTTGACIPVDGGLPDATPR
jgi:NAD(P)-dependent dehydrogenase (short-subunit alcohol dehydrogenase family)